MTTADSKKHSSFRLRTSLRGLFGAMLVCAIAFVWVGRVASEYRREQAILADLNKLTPLQPEAALTAGMPIR